MAPQAADQAGPHIKRILLIEDESDVLEMLQEILAVEGHTAETAEDGEAGLACFQAAAFDIVFTDMNMPGMSGLAVAAEIKKINPRIPVVLMTGWDVGCDSSELQAKGIDLLIKKPFAITDILSAIERLCP